MVSHYDKWNTLKKKIEESNHKPPYFKESDIWWVSIGYNIGYEVYRKGRDYARPVLVIKKFNKDFFLGVPLSTKIKDNKYYVPITIGNKDVSALTSQIRAFSAKRILCKLADLDQKDYSLVIKEVKGLLKLSPSITRGSRG